MDISVPCNRENHAYGTVKTGKKKSLLLSIEISLTSGLLCERFKVRWILPIHWSVLKPIFQSG